MTPTAFGEMTPLRRLCLSKGMSRTQVAAKAGLSRQTLYNIDAGRGFSDETVFKLAQALGVAPGDVVNALSGVAEEAAA